MAVRGRSPSGAHAVEARDAASGWPSTVAGMPTLLAPDRAAVAARVIAAIAGDTASLREDQETAVAALCEPTARVLVVQATGWGKSAVYWAATAIRRSEGAGPTLVVSPLLSLMRDQVAAAERAGLHGGDPQLLEHRRVGADRGRAGAPATVDVLLVSPERLANPGFGRTGAGPAGRLHRPPGDRRGARRLRLGPRLPARLPPRVRRAAAAQPADPGAGHDRHGEPAGHRRRGRPSWATAPSCCAARWPATACSSPSSTPLSPLDRYAWVVDQLPDLPGSGIVYALTVADAERLAETIRARHGSALPVAAYTGGLEPAERERLEDGLRRNRLKALIATSALGMGYDKPDLGFVVHVGSPPSPVSYYQQVGPCRPRRSTTRMVALLPSDADAGVWDYFATATIPDPDQMQRLLTGLEAYADGTPATVPAAGGRDRAAAGAGRADAQAAGRRRRGRAGRAGVGARRVRRGPTTASTTTASSPRGGARPTSCATTPVAGAA